MNRPLFLGLAVSVFTRANAATVYYVSSTTGSDPASGTSTQPITYSNYKGESVTICKREEYHAFVGAEKPQPRDSLQGAMVQTYADLPFFCLLALV